MISEYKANFDEAVQLDVSIQRFEAELLVAISLLAESYKPHSVLLPSAEKIVKIIETTTGIITSAVEAVKKLEVATWMWTIQVWIPVEQAVLKSDIEQCVVKINNLTTQLNQAVTALSESKRVETMKENDMKVSKTSLKSNSLR